MQILSLEREHMGWQAKVPIQPTLELCPTRGKDCLLVHLAVALSQTKTSNAAAAVALKARLAMPPCCFEQCTHGLWNILQLWAHVKQALLPIMGQMDVS